MTKQANLFENKAFQPQSPPLAGFNLVTNTNSFNSIFNSKPLDTKEAEELESLLRENFLHDGSNEDQITKDVEELKNITSEIKAIGKQGIVLMGERVHRAREILKPYKDGTFTKWLVTTFGTRQTGYNMLAYYDLYKALPHENLKEQLKKLPQRTAYILASREGDLDTKMEILREYHDKKHEELVVLIQEKLPLSSDDRRRSKISATAKLICIIEEAIRKLQTMQSVLTEDDERKFAKLSHMLMCLRNVK